MSFVLANCYILPLDQRLKRGSAASRFLGLLVRIPPEHKCLSLVIVAYCQVEVSATG